MPFRVPYSDNDKIIFGRHLTKILADKKMSRAQLAVEASKHLPPKARQFSHQLVSKYARGASIPGKMRGEAISRALGMDPQALMIHRPLAEETLVSTMRMTIANNDTMHLIIDKTIPLSAGWKIVKILQECDAAESTPRK